MSLALHFIVGPFSFINVTIDPLINSVSIDLIISELSLVDGPLSEDELPVSLLEPVVELAFVTRAVWPGFNAYTVLLVFKPGTIIDSAISMGVPAVSMGHVFEPLALVDVSVCVQQLAPAVRFVASPFA